MTLIVGLRHDWWHYHDVYDTGSTNRKPPDVNKAATTYRGGVRVRVSDAVGLRASRHGVLAGQCDLVLPEHLDRGDLA